jgi:gas vesicle protein GvpA/GvpJ/GvpM family
MTVERASMSAPPDDRISLVDLLDRLLGTGVVLTGDVVISLAGVDLVQVQLRALIASVRADLPAMPPWSDVTGG